MNNIKKYSLSSTCPKCGCGVVGTKFDFEEGRTYDQLIRTCQRCDYWWAETPLDTPSNE